MTVRGLEPELHRLMDQHKQELDTIRTLHRAELQRLQDTLTSNNLSQIENMKCQFQVTAFIFSVQLISANIL